MGALVKAATVAGKGLGTVAAKAGAGKYVITASKVAVVAGKTLWVTTQVAAGIAGAAVIGAIMGP